MCRQPFRLFLFHWWFCPKQKGAEWKALLQLKFNSLWNKHSQCNMHETLSQMSIPLQTMSVLMLQRLLCFFDVWWVKMRGFNYLSTLTGAWRHIKRDMSAADSTIPSKIRTECRTAYGTFYCDCCFFIIYRMTDQNCTLQSVNFGHIFSIIFSESHVNLFGFVTDRSVFLIGEEASKKHRLHFTTNHLHFNAKLQCITVHD